VNQLEDQIVATLNDKAADGVDVAHLLAASRTRGQRYARRRRAWQACTGASAAVVAVLGAVAVVPHIRGQDRPDNTAGGGYPMTATPSTRPQSAAPTPRPSHGGGTLTTFRLPTTDAPSAASDPKVVGADPGLLHFDIAASVLPTPITSAQWTSVDGLERLVIQAGKPGTTQAAMLQVQVSRDRSSIDPLPGNAHPVRVGSRTGSVATSSFEGHASSQLRWQPFGGVWAEVQAAGDAASAVKVAEAVTFDHVMRCSVPFRLTWVPAGTTLEACNVTLDVIRDNWMSSVHVGNSTITVTREPDGTLPSAPPTTIAGKPAVDLEYPGDGGHNIFQVDIDYGDHVVDLVAEGHYDKSTVLRIAAGYRDVPGSDPGQWPPSPLG
jgi:hypothetical protein